ncbi:hypothetical protein HOV93_52340 [Planctomycetes bacterium FF15]|uniref:WG repeat-containing protein n=2 Tax=Bremerella alba TaxID=980252 RepID=A0A7V9AAB9_9BACT|nr:hypothetical protein [Bremerella alba]
MCLLNFKHNERYGYTNRSGEVVVDPIFDWAGEFACGVAVVIKSRESGVISLLTEDGQEVQTERDFALLKYRFTYGRLAVKDAETKGCGYIGTDGRVIIEPQFDRAGSFDSRGASVRSPWREFRRVNFEGKLQGGTFIHILPFFATSKASGAKIGMTPISYVPIDATGHRIGLDVYRSVYNENEGLIPVKFTHHEIGWIDLQANEIQRFKGKEIASRFQGGMIAAKADNKWGLMDKDAHWRIEPRFDILFPLGFDLYAAGQIRPDKVANLKLTNAQGQFVSDECFSEMFDFHDGVALVTRFQDEDRKVVENNYIDLRGNPLLPTWWS